jgi:DNA-binding NtrC family response regulator
MCRSAPGDRACPRKTRNGGVLRSAPAVYTLGARAALSFLGGEWPYHLFVPDVRLPDMNGLTLAHRIAVQYPAGRFLFISGFPKLHGEALPTSPWAFLPKPFSGEQLLDAVRQLLPQPPSSPPAS